MSTNKIYIYGIMLENHNTDMLRLLENSELYTISFKNILAIVSDTEDIQLDQLNKKSLGYLLIHHQKTIEALQLKGSSTLIPMKFYTVVGSKQEVIKVLANGYELIITTLKKTEYLTEIDLAATWDNFPEILKEISGHPEIVSLRDEIQKKIDILSQADQMKIGMLVQSKLKEKNTKTEFNILDSLSQCSLDIKTHQVMNDEMVTNSAFLININNQGLFEKIVDQLDEEYKGLLNFKLVGPLPCYSFYTLEVNELNLEIVLQAIIELRLGDETTESEIKKAYLEKAKLFHPDAHPRNGDKESFNKINMAYRTLINYSAAIRQSSNDDNISLAKEKVIENLILVKIME
ncbi:MAG: GvpL/GvpF family gas vesicle protein [Candidatus Marinimicrobia bacterium]|nr:GvpL/GvpF family gas vesicle protein [Candidatus Neomarinimicrobiota bacterium]